MALRAILNILSLTLILEMLFQKFNRQFYVEHLMTFDE